MMKVENEWIVYVQVFFTISCFGTMYSVESIIAFNMYIVVNWCEHKNMSEDENE